MAFHAAADVTADDGTSGTLDASRLFSGAGRYPAKLGYNIALTAGTTAAIAADIQVGADDGGTQRWVTIASVTAVGDGEVTFFPEMEYRILVGTVGTGNTLRCAFFL